MKRPLFLIALCTPLMAAFFLVRAQSMPTTGPSTEKRFPPLKAPPGFKVKLFACDPLIEYPSVIAAGDRPGEIFVAVDYMTGLGSDGKVKSEIRLVEDTDDDGYADKATPIATGFNSIQGLAYQDGTIYVMHAPFLSRLRKDDGWKRTDLLMGLGLKPEDNASRLHCANGVVIEHDGWLYLAQGDNGIDVPRPEGDRLVLHGGGILRCRPDGRDLHVFATGLRNIYDVALDAELNVFTRDNENDGGTYMNRVYHSFFGADHGYPYDYEERPDHALKPICDCGLGSSAGGVCYLEPHMPKEYRGNLFFCEWGRSVMRYPLTPAASGFAPTKEIEFLAGDPKDPYPFKPTDIIVQRDGTLMISDYADGQRPKRGRGRIYQVRFVGRDQSTKELPPPADTFDWLNSPSYIARCEAQRFVEHQPPVKRRELLAAAARKKLGMLGRMHRLWALANSEGAAAMPELLEIARSDPDLAVRIQAVRALGDLGDPVLVKHKLDAGRGNEQLAKDLATLPNAQNARLLREITIVLGRLRWRDTADWLKKTLENADDTWQHAALGALRNWPAVLRLLNEPMDSPIRRVAVRALADRHETDVVDAMLRRSTEAADPSHRREAVELLTRVYKKPGPWKYWGYRPGPRPANSEPWERTDAIVKALDDYLANSKNADRGRILERMRREKVPVQLPTLTQWLKVETQATTVATILTALRDYPLAETRLSLESLVRNANQTSTNRIAALDLLLSDSGEDVPARLASYVNTLEDGIVLADVLRRLGSLPRFEPGAKTIASKLQSADAGVRAAALDALGKLGSPLGRDAVLPALSANDVRLRRAGASAAGKLNMTSAIEPLLKLGAEPDVELRRACLDSLRRLRETRAIPLAVAALKEPRLERVALEYLAELGSYEQTKAVVEFARHTPSVEGVTLSVRALTAWHAHVNAAKRPALYRAIAEIQGATGMLTRWDVAPPATRDGVAKLLAMFPQPVDASTSHLAIGAEARLTLQRGAKAWHVALTPIEVGVPTSVEFLGSSNSLFDVYLNGKAIHTRAKPGKFQLDSERFTGMLDKGRNRIAVVLGDTDLIDFHLRFRRKSSKDEHEKLTQLALSRTGNSDRGRHVFLNTEKSLCLKCHRLADQGERIGPELTGVGSRFSRIHLIESILEPSRAIAPSFGTFAVTLKSGKTLNGVKILESEASLTIADNQGHKHVLARKEIDELLPLPTSVMPEGLELRLTADEFIDLIAFLTSQKERP